VILLFAFAYRPTEVSTEKSNLETSKTENFLVVGIGTELKNLDPLIAYEFESFHVIDQVAEGLFGYDYYDPNLAIIPKLAANYGDWDGNTYTVELRQGVEFHDGSLFKADAVKFWFDRLQYFMDNGMAAAGDLYRYYDYETDEMKPIINNVNIINDYLVEFELDTFYSPLETLLCFESSFILSPTLTPPDFAIDPSTELIGTGPFVFEYFDPGVEVSFKAFESYWNGRAIIDDLKFRNITDPNERADLLASGEVHMIFNPPTDRKGEFENLAYVLDSIESSIVMYLGMNNYWIDKDLREAISYAVDYDYLTNVISGGEAIRSSSPLPNGIKYSDDSLKVATLDLERARTVMQGLGYGDGLDLDDDDAWEASTFRSLTFTRHVGSQIRADISVFLQENLRKIGIEVVDTPVSWWEFIQMIFELNGYNRENLQLFWWGWGADYNDPSNIINTQFTNRTLASNLVHYDGYQSAIEAGRDPFYLWDNVQLLMEEALLEKDSLLREQYYQRIQQLLVEEDRPWAYGFVPLNHAWYSSAVQGIQMNSLARPNYFGVSGINHEVPDTTPPVTEILLDGTMGYDNWYSSDVLVTLKATDDDSGVGGTGYTLNGGAQIMYKEPFLIEETTIIWYGSGDYAGNLEIPKTITVKIDKTPPETEISLSGIGINDWYVSDVFVTLEATDDLSGVAGIGYSFTGELIPYTGPFVINKTTTFGYGSMDLAGNKETLMITIEIYRTPSVITDKIIELLEDLDVPPSAQKEVDKALYDLQAALRKFDRGWFYSGIQRIFKAFKHLMDAQDDGADVFSIGYVLVGMVMNMVDNAINDAIVIVGEGNKFVMKAQEFYNDAIVKLSEGKYDQAINSFKHAYKFAMKARIRGIIYQIWNYFCGSRW